MRIKATVKCDDGEFTEAIIHQFGEVYGSACAFVTRIEPFDGKVLCVRLDFIKIEREEVKDFS